MMAKNKKDNSTSMMKGMRKAVYKELDDEDDEDDDDDDDFGFDEDDADLLETVTQYNKGSVVLTPSILRSVKIKPSKNDKYALRKIIHDFWLNHKVPRLNTIIDVVNADKKLPNFSWQTLHRCLNSMDFEYTRRENICAIVEKSEIIVSRRKYLKDIKKFREEGRPIYYLDEMMVKVEKDVVREKVSDSSFKGDSANIKGKRLVVCHVGSENGFVPGTLMSFEYKKHSQNNHDKMNSEFFSVWLGETLPQLEENAVIVMDDAPYHLAKQVDCPNPDWKKAEIILWLESKGEVVDKSMVLPELMEIVDRFLPTCVKYAADELALKHNKIILRLPSFHNDLNPMRLALSAVKDYVNLNNKTFKVNDVRDLVAEGIEKINADMWKDYISRTIEVEKTYWKLDVIIDELTEISYLPVYNSNRDEDTDSSSSDIM